MRAEPRWSWTNESGEHWPGERGEAECVGVGEEGGRGRDAATQSECVLLAGAQAEGQVVSLLLTVRPGQSPPPQSEDLFI